MLVQDLLKAILEVVGVVTLDEVPEASDMQKCKRHVNLLLGSLSARGLLQLSVTSETFPLVAGKGSYTIGLGADLNTAKPISIQSAMVDDLPVELLTRNEHQVDDSGLYYDPGVTQAATPRGTLHLFPTPDTAATLTIDTVKYLTEFVNLTDTVTFPAAYHAMLVYNGAVRCWRPLGRSGLPPSDIRMEAERTMKIIESMNAKQAVMRTDLPGCVGGTWDIMTGEYR